MSPDELGAHLKFQLESFLISACRAVQGGYCEDPSANQAVDYPILYHLTFIYYNIVHTSRWLILDESKSRYICMCNIYITRYIINLIEMIWFDITMMIDMI